MSSGLWFQDVADAVAQRLAAVGPVERRAFAVGCAVESWRLAGEISGPLCERWRKLLQQLRAAGANVGRLKGELEAALAEVERLQERAQAGEPVALEVLDSDPVVVSMLAARCALEGDAHNAGLCGLRVAEQALARAGGEQERPEVQAELRRQLDVLSL